ncbi:MAG: hypothetical protein ACJ75B_09540 [Flavisolibacter sp.]
MPVFGFSQQKKDTKIIVSSSDTVNLVNRIAIAFIEKGYSIDQKDPTIGFVATGEKPMKNYAASTKIRAIVKVDTITFTSFLALDVEVNIAGVKMARTFDPVFHATAKGNLNRKAWDEMEEIATQFGSVTYGK